VIVVAFAKPALLKSTPLGKCAKEALLEDTVLRVVTEASVQLTTTITFSESCDNPSTALTDEIRTRFTHIAIKQTTREQSKKSFLMICLNLFCVLSDNKTLHSAHDGHRESSKSDFKTSFLRRHLHTFEAYIEVLSIRNN
jgi:hypothetical protein